MGEILDIKESLKLWKKYIRKNWGKRCESFNINCGTCQQWLALEILQENVDLEKITIKQIKKGK